METLVEPRTSTTRPAPAANGRPAPDPALERRLGRFHVRQRLGLQDDLADRLIGPGRTLFHVENWRTLQWALETGLRMLGLRERGRRNCLDVAVEEHRVALANLPPAFEGFTILQLSDLHIDLNPRLAEVVAERLRDTPYDLCVLTGDYRGHTWGPFDETLRWMERIACAIRTDAYAVLGNHDVLEMTPPLEAMGLRMLINETVALRRGESALYLSGVDDPHTFQLDNLEKCLAEVPPAATVILLSHSPELYQRAAHAGVELMLCGHTHGGQICLPGGRPVLKNARCPRRLTRGPWRWHQLQGYTSRGAGASLLDARFHCRPEITLHRLVGSRPGGNTGMGA